VAKNETELATGLALGSPGTTNITRIRLQIWWGEAPERPDNTNEATDVGELQGHVRAIRMPSRGSAVSLVSRFGTRNGRMDRPAEAFPCSHDRPRLGERVGVARS
jgi:hypothetical protein